MFCGHCGRELNDGAKFCPGCGTQIVAQPVEPVTPQQPAPKKKPKTLTIVLSAVAAVIVLTVAAIGIVGFSQSSNFKGYKKSIQEANFAECVSELSGLEKAWDDTNFFSFGKRNKINNRLSELKDLGEQYAGFMDIAQEKIADYGEILKQYNFGAEKYDALEDIVVAMEAAVDQREGSNLESLINEADVAYVDWVDASNAYIEGRIDEYNSLNLATADPSDKTAIEDAVAKLTDLLAENPVDYDSVADVFTGTDEIFLRYVKPANPLAITVQQVDITSYPNVKLYLNVKDSYSNTVNDLDGGLFYIRKQDANGNYIKQQIKSARQLNELEALNINMVADVSGSMDGYPLTDAKNVMNSFIDSVQFGAGDKVALTSFSDGVYIDRDFTNDSSGLKQSVNGLYAQDMTALYDALYTSVNKVAATNGAKCVIAFTDGMDNYSKCTPDDVIALAQRYHVPIFIIGIGSEDYSIAQNIAVQTGGFYFNTASISSMSSIYAQIYKQEKEMYMVEFEDSSNVNLFSQSSIVAGYNSALYGGEISYSYVPYTLKSVDSTNVYTSGPEQVVASYMIAFADAMTNKDYSYISPYIQAGSALALEQEKYVQRGIAETIDTYEIEAVDYQDANNCVITTRETYFVQKANSPVELMTQRCSYSVTKVGNDWKMTGFVGEIEVLSRIKYN